MIQFNIDSIYTLIEEFFQKQHCSLMLFNFLRKDQLQHVYVNWNFWWDTSWNNDTPWSMTENISFDTSTPMQLHVSISSPTWRFPLESSFYPDQLYSLSLFVSFSTLDTLQYPDPLIIKLSPASKCCDFLPNGAKFIEPRFSFQWKFSQIWWSQRSSCWIKLLWK